MPPGFRGMRHVGRDGDVKRPQVAKLWRTFRPFIVPHTAAMAMGTACVFLSMALGKCQPLFTRALVDNGLTPLIKGPWSPVLYRKSLHFILIIVGIMVAAGLVTAFVSYVRTRIMSRAGASMVRSLRSALYSHLQRMSLSFYESRRTGDVMSRLTGDVGMTEMLITHVGDQFVMEIVNLLVTLVILFALNWRLACVALGPVPVLLLLMHRFGKVIHPIYREIRTRMGAISSRLQDNISGIRVIKAFNQEVAEAARFETENQGFFDKQMEGVRVMARAFPVIGFVQGLGSIAVTGVGGWMLLRQNATITLGDLFAFNAYVGQLYQPIGHLFRMYNSVLQALAASERIAEVLEAEPKVTDGPDAGELPEIRGEVVFEDVCFSYDATQPVLQKINVRALPGQTIALVGRSGSGKTTLANLIPRFYDPTEGRITVDGIDLRQAKLASLRRQIAIVLQDPFLFNGTIAENIRYARADASDDEVRAAAEAANAHEFIAELEKGYEAEIGERGVKLSGGQKQRLSIARAILADRRILVLDEATSMIDTHSEILIQAALERLMLGRTTFVIAHRLSTVQRADQILVVANGSIAEQGTHEELLRRAGLYADMYRAQFRLDDEDALAQARRAMGAMPPLPSLASALD